MFRKIIIAGLCSLLALSVAPETTSDDHRPPPGDNKTDAPIEVELSFTTPPALNQLTTLNFKVTPRRAAPNTKINLDLPVEGFKVISGVTELTDDLAKDETKIYQIDVLPVAMGQYHITATATSRQGDFSFGKRAELFVVFEDEINSRVSRANILSVETTPEVKAEKVSGTSRPVKDAGYPENITPKIKSPVVAAAPGTGQIVVYGYWYYRDKYGVDRPLRDARVEIWDHDVLSSDDLLDTTYTNNSGYYESGVISNSDPEFGTQDVYIKVYSTDDFSVKVTDFSSNLYYSQLASIDNVSDGYVDAGSYSVTDTDKRMSFYIYDKIANDAYDYLVNTVGWVNSYNVQVRWTPTSTTGTYYSPGGSISLLAGDRWDIDVFLHEYGHFVMDKIYNGNYPPTPNCNPHRWGVHSSLGCAWSEGWANFLQAAIQNDRYYDDTEDQTLSLDFEPPSPAAHHAEDEGAVSASLWDIYDSASESWDSTNLGINGIWNIVINKHPLDIKGFYNEWINSSNGYNSQITSVFQHHQIIDQSITVGQGAPNPQLFVDAYNRNSLSLYVILPPINAVHRWDCNPCDPGNPAWGKGWIQDFDGNDGVSHDALMQADTNSSFVALIYGGMWVKYLAVGGPHYNGNFTLGYPIADRNCSDYNAACYADSQLVSPFNTYYHYQRFQGGALVLHKSGPRINQTYEVHGAIRAKWQALGGPGSGSYGLPISDEYDWQGKRRSDFEGGSICYNPATNQTEPGCVTPPTTRTLTVASSNPSSGVGVTISPADNSGLGNGATPFTRVYNNNTLVYLTAPSTAGGHNFWKWQRNGLDYSTNKSVSVAMGADYTLTAFYTTPTLPSATTAAATLVTSTKATLNGSVNPHGADTTAWFEWGTSSTLATFSKTAAQSVGSGTTNVAISRGLTGLAPNTTYYFRAAGSNSGGTAKGGILSFRTPALPALRVNNVSVTEANTGSNTLATFTVSLSAASSQNVTVRYATANGSAVTPSDYTALALTTLTFSPGQTTKTVTVQVKGDALDEVNETFSLMLSSPTNAAIADGQGVCTILDNDLPPRITISNAPAVTEPDTGTIYAYFTVKLSAVSGRPISVKYATGGGTASAGIDYVTVSLTGLSFLPGQTAKTIRVQVKGDTVTEANETFFVNLSSAVNATIADAQGQGTILNDD